MAQQTINVGASPNDGTGTPLRTAFQYTNSNFSELYTAVGPSGNNIVVPGTATISGDLTVRTNKLAVTSTGVGIWTATPYSTGESLNARTTALTSIAAFQSMPLTVTDSTAYAAGVGGGINFRAKLDSSSYSNYAAIWSYRESATNSDYRGSLIFGTNDNSNGYPIERYRIASDGVATWSNVGGVANTAMTLNATGLGVGASPSSGGSISNASYVLGGIFSTLNGILPSVATATPTTIFAAPSESILMVTASVNGASPSDYKVVAVVKRGGAAVAITTISSAASITITASGTDIQATQTSGGTQNIYFNVLRLA